MHSLSGQKLFLETLKQRTIVISSSTFSRLWNQWVAVCLLKFISSPPILIYFHQTWVRFQFQQSWVNLLINLKCSSKTIFNMVSIKERDGRWSQVKMTNHIFHWNNLKLVIWNTPFQNQNSTETHFFKPKLTLVNWTSHRWDINININQYHYRIANLGQQVPIHLLRSDPQRLIHQSSEPLWNTFASSAYIRDPQLTL